MNSRDKPQPVLKVCVILLCTVGLLGSGPSCRAQVPDTKVPNKPAAFTILDLEVMSFNIRNGRAKDGENRWENRKGFVRDVIRAESPDVVAIQEAYHFQLEYLLAELEQYAVAGTGRDGGTKGEYSCILYLKDRFELMETNTFWLSETPEKPSVSWGNRYRRICTWAELRERTTQRELTIYNTHMDHQSVNAREKGAQLIMMRIAARQNENPFVLCGDLNADEDSKVIRYLKGQEALDAPNPIPLVDTWRVLHPDDKFGGTISDFNGWTDNVKIDHILAAPDVDVLSAEIIRTHREGRYPSDHYPVTARLRFD
ncbi:endonuclease [Coraliomargarita sinensis]|uniref:Endonuclease n=1 Tax=Coraliomargarita sinensis TaxID=2174842 RepID=A0A317ZE58_9BACT|nr:endonuclease/exonuclease/phosphatase family protein [Coraliomargarita sinensis]PXA03460.1 endonuclease [Coraliomargarita sinensis]